MATWKNDYVRINEYSRPGLKLNAVRKLIVHWTANPGGTASNHQKYFNNPTRYASAHIFVDKSEATCIVPLDEVAYAANDGSYRGIPELKPNANFLSISVEMCVEKDGSLHADTISRSVAVFAELCKTYKLDPARDIVRHYDVTHKNCPAPWVSDVKAFNEFKAKVGAEMMPKFTQSGIIRHIYTGGHAYANLQSVHTYLFKGQHGFDVKRGNDGSIVFLVGPFDTGAKNFRDCKAELEKYDKHIKLLTREEAAEWRTK